jgi:hypothetical protein
MSIPPPPAAAPPQYSEDGQWWWNGRQWERVQPPPGFAERRGFPVWGWIGIGCGVLLLLSFVAGIVFSIVGYRLLTSTGCPPSDFPRPANSRLTNWHVNTGTAGSTCTVAWTSDSSQADLTSYYQARLATGDWHIVAANPQFGFVDFSRVSNPSVTGQLTLVGHGGQTDVDVRFLSRKGDFNFNRQP